MRSGIAAIAAIAISGTVVLATASPAQAMPRSCNDIMSSVMFFELAMDGDTGPYARYWARDSRMFNYEIRLYNNAGC